MAGSRFKAANGTLLGGDNLTGKSVSQGDVRGVFAKNPATTPKYHTGNTDVTREYMARLFIPFASGAAREVFVNTVPPQSRTLAKHLALWNQDDTPYGLGYIDFLLQSANEQYAEKIQVVDAVGDNYVAYYLGRNPPVFQYSGALLNSYQDNWRAAFTLLYNDILRGTMLARRKVVAVLAYDDVLVTGSLNHFSNTLNADFETAANFNFSMLVKRYDFSSRSPQTQFKPTPVATYPYKLSPSAFASVPISGVTKSIWAADTVSYTTPEQRKKNAETGATVNKGLKTYVVSFESDPDAAYIAKTLYNATIGQVIAALETMAVQKPSDELDEDLFAGPQSKLPPDMD